MGGRKSRAAQVRPVILDNKKLGWAEVEAERFNLRLRARVADTDSQTGLLRLGIAPTAAMISILNRRRDVVRWMKVLEKVQGATLAQLSLALASQKELEKALVGQPPPHTTRNSP